MEIFIQTDNELLLVHDLSEYIRHDRQQISSFGYFRLKSVIFNFYIFVREFRSLYYTLFEGFPT